jgi:anti-sigma regulatory factor (Ser/Thr protein kinase)
MNKSILIIDGDHSSNEHLRGILHPQYDVVVSPTLDGAREQIISRKTDLALGDFEIYLNSGINFPEELRRIQPSVKTALISRLDTEYYISHLLPWDCFHVFPKLPCYNARDVFLFIDNILDPFNAFGLGRYLDQDAETDEIRIKNRFEKNRTVEHVINFFAGCEYEIHELYDIRLIMEELINNAVFHAFVDENGHPRYHVKNFESLDSSEEVWLSYGADATTIGFSITDNRGLLKPGVIIDKLSRQYNREGLYDERGRGLYLARLLSGNMVLNIEEGRRTQIACLFYEKRINIPKPFSINYTISMASP